MGIPSYYKRLIDRFPKLVKRGFDALPRSDVLLMDFNCLIYQCVRGAAPYRAEDKDAWEAALLEAVKAYTVKVWGAAGRPKEVFIAVDGVVPMAKIRQQRLRRFKAPWWAAQEREAGVRAAETWDTNAITPGTEFMEKLSIALRGLCSARGAGWSVSAADEPGEGEQKLMAWIRALGPQALAGKEVVVYGLDADLIVLSLLGLARSAPQVASWCLLRELAEFERDGRAGVFGALDIKELLRILVPSGGSMPAADYMLEYVCAMSFLGNDFLPHSLTVKMRDEGHDKMRAALQQLHATGARLVSPGGQVQTRAAAAFVAAWAAAEEGMLAEAIEHKYKMRQPPPRTDAERAMVRVQNLPFEWREECAIATVATGIGSAGGRVTLTADWREVYYRRWLRGAAPAAAVRIYVEGLQWILDYYTGRPVSYAWQYPWNLPPLWADLQRGLEEGAEEGQAPPATTPVAPQEQLAMVLPLSSWGLVRRADLRGLPAKAPAFWPQRFDFFSAGKRWMWECEAEVPVLSVERLRGLLAAV
jgi:5'-3' exonuclease